MNREKTGDGSSLLLTHWDPDIYSPRRRPRNLTELVLFALMYGNVAIQDGSLILNDYLLRDLQSPNGFDCFAELLGNGFVKILCVHARDYRGPTECDPLRQPVSAMAEEQSKYRSFKGKQWTPTARQAQIYARLDKIVKKRHLRLAKKLPPENLFKKRLEFVLANRKKNQLTSRPAFKRIDDKAADMFIAFCQDNGAWQKFLRAKGVPGAKIKETDFYRTAAYQCVESFPHAERALRNLFQSVYAEHICDLERTEGVYTGNLCEIPIIHESEEEASAARDDLIRIEVRPIVGKDRQISIPLGPGIADVIAETRRSDAFSTFQRRFVEGFSTGIVNEQAILRALDGVAVEFAYHSARVLTKPTQVENTVWDLTAWVLRGGEFLAGYGFKAHGNMITPLTNLVPDGIAKLGPRLSSLVRSSYFFTKVRKEVSDTLRLRCTRVKPG